MPRIPRVRIAEVLSRRDAIEQDEAVNSFFACHLEANLFDEFVGAVFAKLPTGIRYEAVYASLLHLIGQQLTRENLAELSWRLAGNLPRLKACRPAEPWVRQPFEEWVPLQVLRGTLMRSKKGKAGALLVFRIMAGTSCPLTVEKFWTRRFCGAISRRLGFGPPWGRHPFQSPLEFVGLRLMGLVEPALCRTGPMFEKILDPSPSSCVSWNRSVIAMRARLNPRKFVCPKDYPLSHLCYQCPIGQDQCPVAVHAVTYVARQCRTCQRRGWFDPRVKGHQCIDCDANEEL